MKISYRGNLGIRVIETGFYIVKSAGLVATQTDEQITSATRETFSKQKHLFKPIKIISKNMSEVIMATADKMIKDEIWNNIGNANGSIIINGFTFCYQIIGNGNDNGIHSHNIFIFHGSHFIAYQHQSIKIDKKILIVPTSAKSLLGDIPNDENTWQETIFSALYTTLIATINFLKYADVQDKHIKARSRERDGAEKYINETNSDIHYITSHYIQNLYVQGAFKVTGHWRLQPKKKEGEWTKELIWINEFDKKGYTRKAGILKIKEDEAIINQKNPC